jgi:hypothetical protein
MKMDALTHQGQACGQVGHKSRDTISETESGRQIQRYIRLTNLIPGILEKVDREEIALTPAVELSYLNKYLQEVVLDAMEQEDCTPSYSQTVRMKKLYNNYQLDVETIYEIMAEDKANQREKISFHVNDLRDYFPRGYTASQMSREILQACSMPKGISLNTSFISIIIFSLNINYLHLYLIGVLVLSIHFFVRRYNQHHGTAHFILHPRNIHHVFRRLRLHNMIYYKTI